MKKRTFSVSWIFTKADVLWLFIVDGLVIFNKNFSNFLTHKLFGGFCPAPSISRPWFLKAEQVIVGVIRDISHHDHLI